MHNLDHVGLVAAQWRLLDTTCKPTVNSNRTGTAQTYWHCTDMHVPNCVRIVRGLNMQALHVQVSLHAGPVVLTLVLGEKN